MSEGDFMNKYNLKKAENTEDYKIDDETLIKELKLEIERLNKECDTYMEVATRKARRIREAIEYIEEKDLTNNMNFMDDGIGNLFKDILDILKGSDE